jgi:hypothetical protein
VRLDLSDLFGDPRLIQSRCRGEHQAERLLLREEGLAGLQRRGMSPADRMAEVVFVPKQRQGTNGVNGRWSLSSSAGSSKETTTGPRRRMLDECTVSWLGGGGAWDWELGIWRWRVADLNECCTLHVYLYSTHAPSMCIRTIMLGHLISGTFSMPCYARHEHLSRHVLSRRHAGQ